jgi:hypothetical protein
MVQRAQSRIDQPARLKYRWGEVIGRSMRGQARWSPVLVQHMVLEDHRCTRAVEDESKLRIEAPQFDVFHHFAKPELTPTSNES